MQKDANFVIFASTYLWLKFFLLNDSSSIANLSNYILCVAFVSSLQQSNIKRFSATCLVDRSIGIVKANKDQTNAVHFVNLKVDQLVPERRFLYNIVKQFARLDQQGISCVMKLKNGSILDYLFLG